MCTQPTIYTIEGGSGARGPSLGRQGGVMASDRSSRPTQRRYPPELRERAVRMVLETIEQTGVRHGSRRSTRGRPRYAAVLTGGDNVLEVPIRG
jgi:hypothetical protein